MTAFGSVPKAQMHGEPEGTWNLEKLHLELKYFGRKLADAKLWGQEKESRSRHHARHSSLQQSQPCSNSLISPWKTRPLQITCDDPAAAEGTGFRGASVVDFPNAVTRELREFRTRPGPSADASGGTIGGGGELLVQG